MCVVLHATYWYLRYALRDRDIQEMMIERGINIDHSVEQRWVAKYSEMLEEAFLKKKKPVGKSCRMDETYMRVKGKWCYLCRTADKENNAIDFCSRKNGVKRPLNASLTKPSTTMVYRQIAIDNKMIFAKPRWIYFTPHQLIFQIDGALWAHQNFCGRTQLFINHV